MSQPHTPEVLFFFALVLLSAVFAGMEAALTSLNKAAIQRISERGRLRARLMALYEEQPDRVGAALMIGKGAAGVAASVVASGLALDLRAGLSRGGALAIAAGVVVLILLVLGELAPKAFARGRAEAVVSNVAGPIRAFLWAASPVSWTLSKIASGIAHALGGRPPTPAPAVTEEEMKALMEAGVEEGAIEQEEQKLIHSIFAFADTTVREVMVPRVDMVCVEATASMEEVLEVFAEKKFSRMPVYDETVDNIVGIIHIKNILNFWRRQITDMKAMEFVVFPHFVPVTKKVIELLEEFRQRQLHMAIVVDEYGGTAGLVTMEDLIEEIVGEIEDEHRRPAPPIKKLEDGSYVADARVEIDHLNELLSLDLPKGEFETVGGLLYHRLGKIPARGEQTELDGVRFTVLEGDARRIRRVKVEVAKQDDGEVPGSKLEGSKLEP